MVDTLIDICLCLLPLVCCVLASSITYELDENIQQQSQAALLRDQITTSRRHCAQLCTADGSCVAANYDAHTGQCQLLALPLGITSPLTGSSVLTSFPIRVVEDLLAFWPLNKEYGGRDMVTPGVSDIHLYGVTFDDNGGAWRSPPARFAGASTSYGQIVNSPHLALAGSFSWMAAFQPSVMQDGPLFNVDVGGNQGFHMWLFEHKPTFFNTFPNCGIESLIYSTPIVLNQWHEVAVAYDHPNRRMSIWVNGQIQSQTMAPCSEDAQTSSTISIGKRLGVLDTRYFAGDLTCMSLYDGVKSYDYMYDHTMAGCKKN